ncbi:MAG: hypothetical protein LUD39_04665 [Opitutae bacterium]|nr:hypothetical protein [Opitutae bacterium]
MDNRHENSKKSPSAAFARLPKTLLALAAFSLAAAVCGNAAPPPDIDWLEPIPIANSSNEYREYRATLPHTAMQQKRAALLAFKRDPIWLKIPPEIRLAIERNVDYIAVFPSDTYSSRVVFIYSRNIIVVRENGVYEIIILNNDLIRWVYAVYPTIINPRTGRFFRSLPDSRPIEPRARAIPTRPRAAVSPRPTPATKPNPAPNPTPTPQRNVLPANPGAKTIPEKHAATPVRQPTTNPTPNAAQKPVAAPVRAATNPASPARATTNPTTPVRATTNPVTPARTTTPATPVRATTNPATPVRTTNPTTPVRQATPTPVRTTTPATPARSTPTTMPTRQSSSPATTSHQSAPANSSPARTSSPSGGSSSHSSNDRQQSSSPHRH